MAPARVLAEALVSCPEFDAIDAGFVPENHLEVIARKKPDTNPVYRRH